MALAPADWVLHINREANSAVSNGVSRYSMEWGKWSSDMNRYIRGRIESPDDPDGPTFRVVFLYWVLMSQAIEFAYQHKLGCQVNEERFSSVVGMLEKIDDSFRRGTPIELANFVNVDTEEKVDL